MIGLSNGHQFEYMVASGALGFDGLGWPWERPLVLSGLIKPELFTVVLKTLTLEPRVGNLQWHKPWECVKLIPGGSVNKVGLTNPGVKHWCKKIGPKINYRKYNIVASIFGTKDELAQMTREMNFFDIVAIEINVSCPNADHESQLNTIIEGVQAVGKTTIHPIILKLSADQDYLKIAELALTENVQAISLNSVPWKHARGEEKSPLWRLEKRVGGGGGGISGIPAQPFNWKAVSELSEQGLIPVIGSSVMCADDVGVVRALGASAVSFGAIHLRKPWLPTKIVLQDEKRKFIEGIGTCP